MNPSTNSPSTVTEFDFEDDTQLSEDKTAKAVRFAAKLQEQFAVLPMAIFADVRSKKLKHRDVCLYLHLLVKQGKNASLFWGIEHLALLTGTNNTSVKESLHRLAACGHIKRRRSPTSTHTICLTKLLPGRARTEGIRVKGRKVGELPGETQVPVTTRRALGAIPRQKAVFSPWQGYREAVEASDFMGDADGFSGYGRTGIPPLR